jgi:hypothetical protein
MKKVKSKFLPSKKLFTNSENPLSNPLQRPYSGDFDPENVYKRPSVIRKNWPGYSMYTGENLPIAEKQR